MDEQTLAHRDQHHGDSLLPETPMRRVDMKYAAQDQAGEEQIATDIDRGDLKDQAEKVEERRSPAKAAATEDG
jgi:hypothetical protein